MSSKLGGKVRALRRRAKMTQAELAERLGISPSYMNMIELDRRSLSAPLLIKLAQIFQLDLKDFAVGDEGRLMADLLELFGDPLFEGHELGTAEVREAASTCPSVARAVLALYHTYQGVRETANTLAVRLHDGEEPMGMDHGARLPSEEVTDLIQRQMNHFPALEEGAEAIRREAGLEGEDLFQGLSRYLEKAHGIQVRIEKVGAMRGAMRRFLPERRELVLSELLRRGSRNFQLAYQVGRLTQSAALESVSRDRLLTTEDSRALCRVALANYFAAAVLMPYRPFLEAARSERYDIELLCHRFRASFEQVCHRLTTLRRSGTEGIPFHLIRIDIAGNISKKFSGSGIRFARFSGACPLWNVFAAFLTPGMFRVQTSRMPDGTAYFSVARTLRKETGGYHSPHPMEAIEIGCEVRHARELVYADGVDLENLDAAVPVGVTCRLCERMDCEQRAFPPLHYPLQVDENVRGVNFYTPVGGRG